MPNMSRGGIAATVVQHACNAEVVGLAPIDGSFFFFGPLIFPLTYPFWTSIKSTNKLLGID